MLEGEFKKIEDFLKVGGNTEFQMFEEFKKTINDFADEKIKEDILENFKKLHVLVYETNKDYSQISNNITGYLATTLILSKKLLEICKNIELNLTFNEEDKKLYFSLMKTLMSALKKEVKSKLNFFEIFSNYIDEVINIIPNED